MSNKQLLSVSAEYKPAGDQPEAIKEITASIKSNEMEQVLLGVTGSGKPSLWQKSLKKLKDLH